MDTLLRGASGFVDVMIYEQLELNGVAYAIVYGKFYYKVDSWLYSRRIACKVENFTGSLIHCIHLS